MSHPVRLLVPTLLAASLLTVADPIQAQQGGESTNRCGPYGEYAGLTAGGRVLPLEWSVRQCRPSEVGGQLSTEIILRFRNTGSRTIEFVYNLYVEPPARCEGGRNPIASEVWDKLGAGSTVGGEASGHFYYIPNTRYQGRVHLCIVSFTDGDERLVMTDDERAAETRPAEAQRAEEERRLEAARQAELAREREASRQAALERERAAERQRQMQADSASRARSAEEARERERQRAEEERRAEAERLREEARRAREDAGRQMTDMAMDLASRDVEEGVLGGDFIIGGGIALLTARSTVSDATNASGLAIGGTIRKFFDVRGPATRLELGATGHWMNGTTSMFRSSSDYQYDTSMLPEEGIDVTVSYAQPYVQLWLHNFAIGGRVDWRSYVVADEYDLDDEVKLQRTLVVPMVTLGSMREASGFFQVFAYGQPETSGETFYGAGIEAGLGMLQLQLAYNSRKVADAVADITSDDALLFTGGLRFR